MRRIGLVLLLVGVAIGQSQASSTISGTVSGPGGGISGASVRAFGGGGEIIAETMSGGSGQFQLSLPEGGAAWLEAFPASGSTGLASHRIEFVDFSIDREVRFRLRPEVTIQGSIRLPAGVQDASVSLVPLEEFGTSYFVDPQQLRDGVAVAAGAYSVQVTPPCFEIPDVFHTCQEYDYFAFKGVDARGGSVSGIVVPVADPGDSVLPDVPPVASLIDVGLPDDGGVANVRGRAGAALGVVSLAVMNLNTGQIATGASANNGSFSIRMFAPPGASLAIFRDPAGRANFGFGQDLAAATIIQVPPHRTSDSVFATMRAIEKQEQERIDVASVGSRDGGQFWISGDLPDRSWVPGQSLSLQGDARLYSHNVPDVDLSAIDVFGELFLERVIAPDGKQELAAAEFVSHVLTPTGFPIDRSMTFDAVKLADLSFTSLSKVNGRRIESRWSADFAVPDNLPDGIYQLVFKPGASGIPTDKRHFSDAFRVSLGPLFSEGLAGLVEVGTVDNRRLSWVLGINEFSNGSRGTVALEDRERIGVAGHVSFTSEKFILPMVDRMTGDTKSYRLEPYVPLMGVANRGWITPPTIPLEYPSGRLNVRITYPDGTQSNLGGAPFAQPFVQAASGPLGETLAAGSNFPHQYFGLTTLDDRFRVSFDQYGRHEIRMTGTIKDIWGNNYDGGGTYEIYVARTLDIETGVFPSTPFEVGDTFAPVVIVQPGVAADVEIRVRQYPESDPEKMSEHFIVGRANRYGYFHPDEGQAISMQASGEYRVDYTVTYTDERGVLWMGSQSWGSVIETPSSPLVAHGKRGLDQLPGEQWILVRDTPLVSAHMFFPYHTGDIMWMEDTGTDPTFTADVPQMTVQDTQGDFGSMILERVNALPDWTGLKFGFEDVFIRPGEIPLFSLTSTGISPVLQGPASDNHWGYWYAGAARPGVRVREMVSEHNADNGYWRFDDTYNYQLGNGKKGDLPNDFKFQYGGIVYRAPDQDFFYYGIHGSLFVLLPEHDTAGVRVMPPFQGNGGGPSGGPIMELMGEEIDIFFHPTGVRPGSILEVGDIASFSGAIAPTLPSKASVRVTSPSGETIFFRDSANKVGYFHHPQHDFKVTEPGRWQVKVTVTHEGRTSSGQVTAPFPSGGVLGAGNDGTFSFFVVEKNAVPLSTSLAPADFVRPAERPVDISFLDTDDLDQVRLHWSVVMPGFLMDQGSGSLSDYNYDATQFHENFPNLDLLDRDGRTGVDTVTLSFLISGIDGAGDEVFQARQVLLQGEELIAPPQTPLVEIPFSINAGMTDAWFNPATSGQGFFVVIFEDIESIFLAWFTYDTETPGKEAQVGGEGHRWMTAFGPYDGTQAQLDLVSTSNGIFDTGSDVQREVIGSVSLEFHDCSSGTVSYEISTIGRQGSIPIQRIVPDLVPVCENATAIKANSRGAKAGFQINRGVNDAWFQPSTDGQGFFIITWPEIEQMFLSWFTYETELPTENSASLGDSSHRWLTALGPYANDEAVLEINVTTGGVFDSGDPVNNTPGGTVTVNFENCTAGTVNYDISSIDQQGEIAIQRLTLDNVATCETLDGVAVD